tara:strand:+ start:959 stop:1204 length:246 start_codon:yes stop_codon:yes gene_type:complete
MDIWLQKKIDCGEARIVPCGTNKFSRLQSFESKLASITDLDELRGFWDRSKVLGVKLPDWTDEQKQAIKFRAMQIKRKLGQ